MEIIKLYKYDRLRGKTTISPNIPEDKNYTVLYRIIAGEGKAITNGKIISPVVDTYSAQGWEEIEYDIQ